MDHRDLFARPLTIAALVASLASPILSTGCTANVGEADALVDDNGAEVDETAVKEDSSVRPVGRFEFANFDSFEDQGVTVGYTYGLDIHEGAFGTRDYGVNEEQPTVIRREARFRFTRSGSTRYLRATESDADGNETSVRFEYKLVRGVLRLRAANATRWFSLNPVAASDGDFVDAVKNYYNEELETVENGSRFEGRLPFRVQLEYDMLGAIWDNDTGFEPWVMKFTFRDGQAGTTRRVFMIGEDNDGGGSRDFFDLEGNYLASGSYGESTDFSWSH